LYKSTGDKLSASLPATSLYARHLLPAASRCGA
jgi:hypothetical protein